MDLNFKAIFEWLGAIALSLGGTSVIIIGLSKYFGDFFANKLLEKDKAKYQRELEEVKSNFQSELEKDKAKYQGELEGVKNKYQAELEIRKAKKKKSKALFFRYSEHQFSLYNALWKNLCDLKQIGEDLWEKAEPEKIKRFSEQLRTTKLEVENSALLIEDTHYKELTEIIDTFGSFRVGKARLVNLRNKQSDEFNKYGINENEIRNVIERNGKTKEDFTLLLDKLSQSFKRQIKGEQ